MSERFANSMSFDETRRSAAAEPASVLGPGDRVGPYVLEARLGAGGFGEVWSAEPSAGGDGGGVSPPRPERVAETAAPEAARVALKIALRPEAREALRRQDAAQRRLDHPSIVRVLDEDLAHEPPYVVFDLVLGENLRARLEAIAALEVQEMVPRGHPAGERRPGNSAETGGRARVRVIRRRPLTLAERTERAVPLLRSVADALAHAHAQGIVHGDLKPENVLISLDGRALLTDFGLGTTAAGAEVTLSRSLASTTLGGGTLAYLAPERHAGAPPTPAGDIWSFGIMLFEACHGRLPQGFERPHGWTHESVFAGCYAPAGERLPSGADLVASFARAEAPARRQVRVEPLVHPAGKVAPRSAPRALSGLEKFGIALCVLVGSIAALGWSIESEARESRRELVAAEASYVDDEVARHARLEPARRALVEADLRYARELLVKLAGRAASSHELKLMHEIQTHSESLGYRIVTDLGPRAISAYPRRGDWPVISLETAAHEDQGEIARAGASEGRAPAPRVGRR